MTNTEGTEKSRLALARVAGVSVASLALVCLVFQIAGCGTSTQPPSAQPTASPPRGKVARFHQAPGDPPVTVSDGSLRAHSKNNWASDANNHMVLQPYGDGSTAGSFQPDCRDEMTGNMLPQAYLWTHEDDVWDISPGNDAKNPWKVTITHSVGPVVTVTASGGVLRITTSSGAFDADAKYEHHERLIHPPADATKDVSYVVTSIAVTGASSTADPPLPGSKWDTTTSPYHPHYTLGFCYH